MRIAPGDAIAACLDEEGQHMLEGSSEPTVCVVFSPKKAEEVKHAVRVIERFVAINAELFELVEELQEWERENAGSDSNREKHRFELREATHILLGTLGAALAMIGPGAWSVDAGLFGLKRVNIPTRER